MPSITYLVFDLIESRIVMVDDYVLATIENQHLSRERILQRCIDLIGNLTIWYERKTINELGLLPR